MRLRQKRKEKGEKKKRGTDLGKKKRSRSWRLRPETPSRKGKEEGI